MLSEETVPWDVKPGEETVPGILLHWWLRWLSGEAVKRRLAGPGVLGTALYW